MEFQLVSDYAPSGDQPEAIEKLVASLEAGNKYQTLLGVTGSGKTYTMANIIQRLQRPTLIMSHNKTLAAQLYSEFKTFFPNNAVEYFVSYYDYYQPEAYVPQSDTYIEKDASINDDIERLRIAASSALLSRRDVIVICSVSCIYGLGSPEDFQEMAIQLRVGEEIGRQQLLERLVQNQYQRNDIAFQRGCFRVRGEIVDVFPAYMETALRIEFWGDEIDNIFMLDPLTGITTERIEHFNLYPANQYITPRRKLEDAIKAIKDELEGQVSHFEKNMRLIEAQRLRMRTEYDLELLQEMGICNGIENYSRHLSGRKEGDRPFCLIDFFPDDFLTILDESHVSLPQIGGMYNGDRARKGRLVEYGFRLPSAMDNRPLKAEEFDELTGQTIYVSATPAKIEFQRSTVIAEQIIRPTGLPDPVLDIRKADGQVEDLINEVEEVVKLGDRVLATTLTKRMSEDLTEYLRGRDIRVEYLHSDIDAIERVEILRKLRKGDFDVLVGVNLLREGLDLPEVRLVAILDADKEGFLRSETSLIQTAGRAARHERGYVILYANQMNDSLRKAIDVMEKRREKQLAHNMEHGITPRGVRRPVQASLYERAKENEEQAMVAEATGDEDVDAVIAELETEMLAASDALEFERAALLRDQIDALKKGDTSAAARTTSKQSKTQRKKNYHKGKSWKPKGYKKR